MTSKLKAVKSALSAEFLAKGVKMACGCGKEFAKMTDEVKKLRQSVQDITKVLASLNKEIGEQLNANKEEFSKEPQV